MTPDAPARFDLVTFDVYAALFDFAGSLRAPVARALGEGADCDAFIRLWRAGQLGLAQAGNVLEGGRLSFRDATALALEHALGCSGRSLDGAARGELVDAWDRLEPWPEAGGALQRLQACGHALALLSNGDRAMLAALAERLPVAFDHVFSSEDCGVYKPHPRIYGLPGAMLGVAPQRVLHVAGSPMDVLGAKRAGLACAWTNRRREALLDARSPPDLETADLDGLAHALNAPPGG